MVQRDKNRGPAAKVLVTCELTIFGIGTNSGTGEEWSDNDNALTSAEAQAFERAESCFGLGRYFHDIRGEWVDLDQHKRPKNKLSFPAWATPEGWAKGLRANGQGTSRLGNLQGNGHAGNGQPSVNAANGSDGNLIAEIERMEEKIGKRMYRGLLKRVARAWSPKQIREIGVRQQVLAQMQGAERGLARLQAAQARLAPEVVQKIIVSLTAPPATLEDLHTLHTRWLLWSKK